MKFKVGDILKCPKHNSLKPLIVESISMAYNFKGGFYGHIDYIDKNYIKINYYNSKLGKILYAKSN